MSTGSKIGKGLMLYDTILRLKYQVNRIDVFRKRFESS